VVSETTFLVYTVIRIAALYTILLTSLPELTGKNWIPAI
jgi:hypothetical protein